jgi:hypothetical protein
MISVYYILGYLHGLRHGVSRFAGQADTDPESEKGLIQALSAEVYAIRFGADPEPAGKKVKALFSASKQKDSQPNQKTCERRRTKIEGEVGENAQNLALTPPLHSCHQRI